MAALVIAAAAAGIGAASAATFGVTAMVGAQIGWMAGSLLASALIRPKGQHTFGPRITDKQVTTSTYGAAIPRLYGTIDVAGDYLFCSDLIEHENVTEQGGKGGGDSSFTSYTYSIDCALGVCEGPVTKVLQIYANAELIYDATGAGDPFIDTRRIGADGITVYLGDEDQLPNSVIEAYKGAGNVPGYRGLCYVVLQGLDLTLKYGNRPPTFKFVVQTNPPGDPECSFTAQTFPREWIGDTILDVWHRSQPYPATNISADGQYVYFIAMSQAGPSTWAAQIARTPTDDPSAIELLSDDYYPEAPFNIVNSVPSHLGIYVESHHAYYWMVGESVPEVGNPLQSDSMHHVVRYDITNDVFTWSGQLVAHVDDITASFGRLQYDEQDDVILTVQFTGANPDGNVDCIKLNATTLAIVDTLNDVGASVYWDAMGFLALNPQQHHLIFTHYDRCTIIDLDTFTVVQIIEGEYDVSKAEATYFEVVSHGDYLWVETHWVFADPEIRKFTWNGSEYVYESQVFPRYQVVYAGVTGNAGTDTLTSTGHALAEDDDVVFWALVGGEGTGLTSGNTYYIRNPTANTFQLSATAGGAVVNFTTNITNAEIIVVHVNNPAFNYSPADEALVLVGYTNGDDETSATDMALQLIDVDTDELIHECPFGTAKPDYSPYFGLVYNPAGGMFVFEPTGIHLDAENWTSVMWTFFLADSAGLVYWQDVVEDVAEDVGLANYVDVPERTEADILDGYKLTAQMTGRAAVEPVMLAYFVDAVESGDVIKFVKRGAGVVAEIPEDDLAAHTGVETPVAIAVTHGQDLELPKKCQVSYIRKDSNYESGLQLDERQAVDVKGVTSIELAMVLTDQKALQIASVILYLSWLGRDSFAIALMRDYARLEPTDTLRVGDAEHEMRVIRARASGGVRYLDCVREDASIYTQPALAAAPLGGESQEVGEPGESTLYLLDIPTLADPHDGPGIYAAVTSDSDTWGGALLYRSVDGGTSYVRVATFETAATAGETTDTLGDFTGGNVFDTTNTVTVVMEDDRELESTSEIGALNGVNACVIGAHGRWEVVIYRTATLIAPRTYTLSNLLRGRLGTEWAIPTHAAGDRFVLLNSAVKRIPGPLTELGVARTYKIVTASQALADATPITFTNTGVSLKPYAPVQIVGTRDEDNNLYIEWWRRTRLRWDSLDAREAPLGEEYEQYLVEILSDDSPTTVLREMTATDEGILYLADDQTEDGITPGDEVTVRVRQRSATVGLGYAAEATV